MALELDMNLDKRRTRTVSTRSASTDDAYTLPSIGPASTYASVASNGSIGSR